MHGDDHEHPWHCGYLLNHDVVAQGRAPAKGDMGARPIYGKYATIYIVIKILGYIYIKLKFIFIVNLL